MRLLLTLPNSEIELVGVEQNLKNKLQEGTDKALYSYNLAMIYAQIDQPKLAIRYLVQSIEQGLTRVAKIERQTMFEPLHQLASYKNIIKNMKNNKEKIKVKILGKLSSWQSRQTNYFAIK